MGSIRNGKRHDRDQQHGKLVPNRQKDKLDSGILKHRNSIKSLNKLPSIRTLVSSDKVKRGISEYLQNSG